MERHGMHGTPLHNRWCDIKRRCNNPKDARYYTYGGRGIKVCEEWSNSFMAFYNWSLANGYSPELQIDRINNDGGYHPSNCRYVTGTINAQNRMHLKYNNKSGYRGVSKSNKHSWRAMITWKRKLYDLGTFQSKEEAALAYNAFVLKNGTYHSINMIYTTHT